MPNYYKCKEENCNKSPAFNYSGELKGAYCNTHKKENMINVVSPICNYINCKIRPTYNIPGEKKGLYCKTHKTSNMIAVITKKKCIELNWIDNKTEKTVEIIQLFYDQNTIEDMTDEKENNI